VHEVVETVRRAIEPALTRPDAGICVAISGGLDSSVLLHALTRCSVGRLRAIYVNHQLHADAAEWGRRCERLCATLGVPFMSRRVTVERDTGEGPEAAARRARYQALAESLGAHEVLVTGHHQDDQIETVILNLMRGSGVAGLGGIPRRASLGGSLILRPLLDLPRAVLHEYAFREGLDWIDDPANVDQHLDRNFLRQQVLPALASRWPGIRLTVARSARLCAEAAALLDELAARDAKRVQRAGRVSIAALEALGEPRRRNVLRHLCWRELRSVPPEARLREGLAQLLKAGEDRNPVLAWRRGEIRRYRSNLYLLQPLSRPAEADRVDLPLRAGATLDLGEGRGRLRLVRVRGQGLAGSRPGQALTVRYRSGGERIRPAGQAHTRDLKKLLQERGVVPWMRDRIPLLYCGDVLAAVAGLWVAANFAARATEPGLRVRWDDHPPID
jgi:tRNA(Ile)-lysidine synthase